MGFVLATNANHFGIEAAKGFMLGAGSVLRYTAGDQELIMGHAGGRRDQYFLRVPDAARTFQIRSLTPARLALLDPDGKTVELKADQEGRIDVAVRAGAPG